MPVSIKGRHSFAPRQNLPYLAEEELASHSLACYFTGYFLHQCFRCGLKQMSVVCPQAARRCHLHKYSACMLNNNNQHDTPQA